MIFSKSLIGNQKQTMAIQILLMTSAQWRCRRRWHDKAEVRKRTYRMRSSSLFRMSTSLRRTSRIISFSSLLYVDHGMSICNADAAQWSIVDHVCHLAKLSKSALDVRFDQVQCRCNNMARSRKAMSQFVWKQNGANNLCRNDTACTTLLRRRHGWKHLSFFNKS